MDAQANNSPAATEKDTPITDSSDTAEKNTQVNDLPGNGSPDLKEKDTPADVSLEENEEIDLDDLLNEAINSIQLEKRAASQWAVKLEQWVIFTVIVALLPIVLNAFRIIAKADPKEPLNFYSLIASHGELALVCAAITAEAIGDMFVSGQTKGHRRLYAFGMCCIIFFFSSGIFVIAEGAPNNLAFVANASLAMLACTLLAGGGCKYFSALAEEQRNDK